LLQQASAMERRKRGRLPRERTSAILLFVQVHNCGHTKRLAPDALRCWRQDDYYGTGRLLKNNRSTTEKIGDGQCSLPVRTRAYRPTNLYYTLSAPRASYKPPQGPAERRRSPSPLILIAIADACAHYKSIPRLKVKCHVSAVY